MANDFIFIPKYIRLNSDYSFGEKVTHEAYNELLNLNNTQGDYNTKFLDALFNGTDKENTPRILYLEKMIEEMTQGYEDHFDQLDEHVIRLDDRITQLDTDVNNKIDTNVGALSTRINELTNTESTHYNEVTSRIDNIVNGSTKVGKASIADHVVGYDTVTSFQYYGTTKDSLDVKFNDFPDLVSSDPVQQVGDIDGVFFVPAPGTIKENMFDDALIAKLNREGVTHYDQLQDRPYINNVLLTGNRTLSQLGIQPAGAYLTSIPSTYVQRTELSNYYTKSETSSTISSALAPYATQSSLNSLSGTVNSNYNSLSNSISTVQTNLNNFANSAGSTYARVVVGSSWSGAAAKTGDILITV